MRLGWVEIEMRNVFYLSSFLMLIRNPYSTIFSNSTWHLLVCLSINQRLQSESALCIKTHESNQTRNIEWLKTKREHRACPVENFCKESGPGLSPFRLLRLSWPLLIMEQWLPNRPDPTSSISLSVLWRCLLPKSQRQDPNPESRPPRPRRDGVHGCPLLFGCMFTLAL